MSIEAMKKALEALDLALLDEPYFVKAGIAMVALRQAIEQAEKESTLQEMADIGQEAHTDHPMRHWDRTCPACVAEVEKQEPVDIHCPSCLHSFSVVPVTKREWVGLTNEEMSDTYNCHYNDYVSNDIGIVDVVVIARAIEAKLKERNT
jgi:hypothetical protein